VPGLGVRAGRAGKRVARACAATSPPFCCFSPPSLPFLSSTQVVMAAGGGETAPPRAPSPELALPLSVERSSVKGPRVGARDMAASLCGTRAVPHGGGETFGDASR
jgi:hypothetical protein